LRVGHPQDFLAIIVFLSVAILINSLMTRAQNNLARVEAREREALQLYRLSVDLSGQNDPKNIAATLVRHLEEFFKPQRGEVVLSLPTGRISAQVPTGATLPMSTPPTRRFLLTSPRGDLGEIRIWGDGSNYSPEEIRLLEIFASQGALALDRATLAASETRARVLEESDRLKTAILSLVSHELRTPLATIQASASSLFNPRVSFEPEAREELQSLLLEETEHMTQVVNNLLNMSRLEVGALKLQRQWNSMTEIIDICVARFTRKSSHHKILVDIADELPLISVDSVLMEQVINNIISNSLKFGPPQSTIRINAKADDQMMKITIWNQGQPIPEDLIDHIFEKFYPVPGKDVNRGAGLGLSICKGIIEAHGGKIWAENIPQGVAFNFLLPLEWEGMRPMIPSEESEIA
ncbi:MAG TPA: ATP-binding protein, partial [Anaerolineaceae bacterium]|nr:ATP-binding protein [Anaerolineaceae bacterium]